MAINTQKLLPAGKLSAAERMAAAYDKKIDDLLNLKVKKELLNIIKITNETKIVKANTKKQKEIREEDEQRDEKEKKSEKKKSEEGKFTLPNLLPKTGILDRVQDYITYTFLGYMLTTYGDKVSPLTEVAKLLPSAMDTVGNVLTGTLDFTSALIKGGYETRDKISELAKSVGGENSQKVFDDFTNMMKDQINKYSTLGIYQPPAVPQKANGGLVEKLAVGGNVTRAGKPVDAPVTRTVTAVETRVQQPVVFRQESEPGKDVGGRDKIEKVFPSSKNMSQPGPLNTLLTTSSTLRRVPFVGPLMAAAVDIAMGQKPDPRIYKTFGQSLAYLIGPSIQTQTDQAVNNVAKTVLAMAGGGITRQITTTSGMSQEQFGSLLGKIFQNSIETKLASIFSEILKTKNPEIAPSVSYPGSVTVSSDSPDFWLLSVAALLENSDPQGAADVAQVIYNRVASPAWPGDIRSVILQGNGGQFQPVADYGTIDAWRAIKDKNSAVDFIKKYGKGRTQDQLEQVASALLDTNRQRSAASFVGPRDSFRANSLAEALASDTRVSRAGQTFGFEAGGAQIGKFRAGKLKPAQVSPSVEGSVQADTAAGVINESDTVKVEGNFRLAPAAAKAYLDMKKAAAVDGVRISLSSAWRSYQSQHQLWWGWINKLPGFNPAAQPGTSKHEMGVAIDLADGIPWVTANGSRFGWVPTVLGEPWHFEFNGRYKPSATAPTKTQKIASSSLQPPNAEIASTKPSILEAANKLAMLPPYDSSLGDTEIILQEKIIFVGEQENSAPAMKGLIDFGVPV